MTAGERGAPTRPRKLDGDGKPPRPAADRRPRRSAAAAQAAPEPLKAAKPQRQRRAAVFRGEAEAAQPSTGAAPQRRARDTVAPQQQKAAKPQRQRRPAAFRGEPAAAPDFTEGAPQRIAKLLARAGVASRREIERMIAEGRIAIDGVAIDTPATILTSLKGVSVDGKPVQAASATRLFLFHKPTGLLTAERDFSGRPTIYDRLPKDLPRLMPVGRLDLNTEGLLLLTNDGEFKRALELPATGVERTYRARVFGEISQDQLEDLIHGVEIEGVRYGSIDANLERRTGRNGWIEMKLREGKNREVRRVLEYLGLQVSRLIRVAYGPFVLGDLPVGGVGEVRQHDLAEFRKGLA